MNISDSRKSRPPASCSQISGRGVSSPSRPSSQAGANTAGMAKPMLARTPARTTSRNQDTHGLSGHARMAHRLKSFEVLDQRPPVVVGQLRAVGLAAVALLAVAWELGVEPERLAAAD